MNVRNSRIVAYLFAALIGIIPGFFLVFNSVFSDLFTVGELVGALLLVFVAYLVLGAIFGYFFNAPDWQLGVWLSLAAIVIVLWYTSNEPGRWQLQLGFLIVTLGSAMLGAYIGKRYKLRVRGPDSRP